MDSGAGNEVDSKLPSSDRMFRLLFEEAPCYCCILDPDLNIVAVNRRCRENFTTPFSRRCYQVLKGRKEICPDCPALISMKENRICESAEELTDRSGRDIDVICRTIPIKDNQGKVTGVLHMSVRAGQAEELQLAMTSLDSQLGAVSHGIKGLLTAMVGGFYMWDSGLDSGRPERMEKGINVVRRNFLRLQHLAHDVLYYIRDRRMHMEAVDAAEVLKKVGDDIRDEWGFFAVKIRLEGSLTPGTIVNADRRALESALVNLVISSLDDCRVDKRDIEHEVHLSVERQGGFAVFEVKDNGIGMNKDTLEKVFSLFFNPKGIEAAGVGLFITNKLVRYHGGSVNIESEPGKGTRYQLSIPLCQSEPGE